MKFDANTCAGIGGAVGLILGLLLAMAKYDLSKVDQMQQAVGSIIAFFAIAAGAGWFIGRNIAPRKK
jgi:hypothetical protein